jgi:hypothetical protein
MLLKFLLLATLLSSCASTSTNNTEAKLTEQKCPTGADAVYKDDGSWTCEYLKDMYLKISQEEFKKNSLKSTALDLIKAFETSNPKKVKKHVIKDEMITKPVFFKIQAPYEKQYNRFQNVRGFLLKHKKANFYITTYPLYYTKKFENEEVAVRCNLESYTHTTTTKDLFFNNCQIINFEDQK